MTKENQTQPSQPVMHALAQFANQTCYQFELNDLLLETQELTELLLESELGDERDLRQNALRSLRFIRDYSRAMAGFTKDEVFEQTQNIHFV
jgi:hypothetical protein